MIRHHSPRTAVTVTLVLLVALSALAACSKASSGGPGPASAASVAAGDPIAGWQRWSDPAGLFTVRFPADPTADTSMVPTAIGEIELTMYMAQQGEAVFMVAASPVTLPEGTTFDVEKGLQ